MLFLTLLLSFGSAQAASAPEIAGELTLVAGSEQCAEALSISVAGEAVVVKESRRIVMGEGAEDILVSEAQSFRLGDQAEGGRRFHAELNARGLRASEALESQGAEVLRLSQSFTMIGASALHYKKTTDAWGEDPASSVACAYIR